MAALNRIGFTAIALPLPQTPDLIAGLPRCNLVINHGLWIALRWLSQEPRCVDAGDGNIPQFR